MPVPERVLIAGAGLVGLVAAANLVRHGVPVTVFEAGPYLSEESRASTFHPSTLDMLADLNGAQPLIAKGLITSPLVQQFRDVRAKFPTHRSREFLGKNRKFSEMIREFFDNRSSSHDSCERSTDSLT